MAPVALFYAALRRDPQFHVLAVGFAGKGQAAAGYFLFQKRQGQRLLAHATEHHALPLALMSHSGS